MVFICFRGRQGYWGVRECYIRDYTYPNNQNSKYEITKLTAIYVILEKKKKKVDSYKLFYKIGHKKERKIRFS